MTPTITTTTRYAILDAQGCIIATAYTPSRAQFYLSAFRAACPERTYTIKTVTQ